MRGVGVIEFGGPEALQVVDLPEVHAGPGTVRLRVHAATVNPTDTFTRGGGRAEALRAEPPPYIPGMDAAGVIDEIGPETETALSVGQAVMAMVIPSGSHGAYRESIVLAADAVAAAPLGASHVEASTLPMNQVSAPGYGMYYLWIIRHLPEDPYTGFIFTKDHEWTLNPDDQGWEPKDGN